MTLFIVDVTKQHSITLQTWGNRYIVNASDLTDAASAAPIIADSESEFHFERVNFVQARVATVTANDGIYVTVPLTNVGQNPITGKEMPLFLTLDGVFQVSGFGRPLRKFWHTCFDDTFYDTDYTYDDAFLSSARTSVITMIDNLETNGTPWVKDGDSPIVAVTLKTHVLSHQFTKASKRTTP